MPIKIKKPKSSQDTYTRDIWYVKCSVAECDDALQNALLHDDTLKYIYSIPFKFYKHELLLPLKRIAFSVVIHAEYEGGNTAEK